MEQTEFSPYQNRLFKRYYGKPIANRAEYAEVLRSRLLAGRLVDLLTQCWVWQGHKSPHGYARIHALGKTLEGHRASYELFVGPIPTGLELDHVCKNRACINPEHLEPVTQAENKRRIYADYAVCKNGHPYDAENTYYRPNGQRDCRVCTAARQRAYKARKLGRAA